MNQFAASPRLARLFAPFDLAGLRLRNRLVMAPMTRYFSPHGVPGPDVAAYYRRRAEGGVGLIVTEGTWIPHPTASNADNVPDFHGDAALAGWRRVAETVHAAGGKIIPQLWHVGFVRPAAPEKVNPSPDAIARSASPSGLLEPGVKSGRPLTVTQIESIIAAYAEAAASAQRIGFDGIELHGAHGYLIDQFLWAGTNRRRDDWGGSLERRTRFATEVVRACRARVGRGFPIILRVSQWKQQDYAAKLARTPRELERVLAPISAAGVDMFHCSQRRFWEPEFPGSDRNLAGWVRTVTGKPTITVGSVGLDQEFVSSIMSGASAGIARLDRLLEMLDRGDFDLVAVGRALLSDPAWPEKVRSGRLDELQPFDATVLGRLD